eukprot:7380978-Prymnesium_polylepis.3
MVKEVSLLCETVNVLQWEKIARQRELIKTLKKKTVPALSAACSGAALDATDFPFLSEHLSELRKGTWHGEKLKLIPTAGGDPTKAFGYALKKIEHLALSLANRWEARVFISQKLPPQWALMEGCLDLRHLIRSDSPQARGPVLVLLM